MAQPGLLDELIGVIHGIGHRLHHGPHDVALGVVERQPEDDATRLHIPDRRAFAHEVGQDDQPVGARWRLLGLHVEQVIGRDAQHAFSFHLPLGEGVAQVTDRLAAGRRRRDSDVGVGGVYGVGKVDHRAPDV